MPVSHRPPRRRPLQAPAPARSPSVPLAEALPLLEVRLDPRREGHGLADLFHRERVEVQLIACRLTERTPHRLLRWLDVRVPSEDGEHLLKAMRRRLGRPHLAVAHLGPGRRRVRTSEPAPAVCLATYRAGGICTSCPLLPRREKEGWRVVLPQGGATQALLKSLPLDNVNRVAITRYRSSRGGSPLTPRQDRALRTAYEMGYFDYPRRGSLGEVAHALGAGRSATLEVLRRATLKLAGARYDGELRPREVP